MARTLGFDGKGKRKAWVEGSSTVEGGGGKWKNCMFGACHKKDGQRLMLMVLTYHKLEPQVVVQLHSGRTEQ